MSALSSSSEYLNALAHEALEKLDAGAVVMMALVMDDDGTPSLAIGSTGMPESVRVVAKTMPDVAKHLREAADSEKQHRVGFFAGGTDAN